MCFLFHPSITFAESKAMNSTYTGGNLCAHGFHQPCEEYHDSTKCKSWYSRWYTEFCVWFRGSLIYQSPFIFKYIFILSHEIFQHSVVHIKPKIITFFLQTQKKAALNLQFRILPSVLTAIAYTQLITPPKTAGPLLDSEKLLVFLRSSAVGVFLEYLKIV